MEPKKMTFMMACRDYFGLHPGQTNMAFAEEIKALTPDDKTEIAAGLQANGYQIMQSAAQRILT